MRTKKITNIENDFFHLTYEKQKSTLKEKEITRDYYLERMLIWQQISGFVPSLLFLVISLIITAFVSGALSWKIEDKKHACLLISLLIVTLSPSFIASIYYSRQYWKAYKSCQELAHPSLTPETATESREREREREELVKGENKIYHRNSFITYFLFWPILRLTRVPIIFLAIITDSIFGETRKILGVRIVNFN